MGLILQNQLEKALVKTKDYIDKKIEEIPEGGYSDANVKAVDIGEEIEDVNIEYVTKAELQDAVENINPAPMVSVTYSELVELRDNGELIAGMQYRITDYVTTTTQDDTKSAGHPFDVIVTADSANKLNEVARAGFPAFNIERYRLGFSPSWTEAMNYIGLYEHNGRTYYQYQSASEDMQMLVAFSEEINMTNVTDDPMGQRFMWVIYPSYGRKYENDVWGEWKSGESLGEDIAFETNPNSAYFHDAEAKLEAWKIWYCLDNDAERFAWADAENGKGVIYRMIDEWNNDCPYDFKNIQFLRGIYADGGGIKKEEGDGDFNVFCYTFSWEDAERLIMDASLVGNNGYLIDDGDSVAGVYNNIIKSYIEASDYCAIQNLNDIVCLSTYAYDGGLFYGCNNNIFGVGCHHNSLSSYCSDNIFGAYCSDNYLGSGNISNVFGDECYNNFLDYNCHHNTFGNDCHSNTLGDGSYNNSFGNHCNFNTLGENNFSNNFGNGCHDNTFGNNCFSNSFSNNCYSNSFRDLDGFASFSFCKFDTGVRSLEIYCDDNNGAYVVKYIHVYSGVTGWVEIGSGPREYETCYACNKNGKVIEFCLVDFANS